MKLIINLKVNGVDFHNNSVLSFYGILMNNNNEVLGTYERYYFPREHFNHPNIDKIYILEMRKNAKFAYPDFFEEDTEIRNLFINKDLEVIIGHNLMFDLSFVAKSFKIYKELEEKKLFCTMLNNTY